VDGDFKNDVKLKLTNDGSQEAVRCRVLVTTDSGIYFQFSYNGFWIACLNDSTNGKYTAVLSEKTAIKFKMESDDSKFVYLICTITKDQGQCNKENTVEGDRTDELQTEEDPSYQSKHRLSLYEKNEKEDGGIVGFSQDGKSSPPSEPSIEIAPPCYHQRRLVRYI
jgi:hypothetical protein